MNPVEDYFSKTHMEFESRLAYELPETEDYYVQRSARLYHSTMDGGDLVFHERVGEINPFIFLTGICSKGMTEYAAQPVANQPSLSLVTGQYGVGKTDLVARLSQMLIARSRQAEICAGTDCFSCLPWRGKDSRQRRAART